MVACAARLDARGPGADRAAARRLGPGRRRRGRPPRSPPGEIGELIIGGVGLARYLDPAKDAEKYAPMPTPGLGARLPQRGPRALRRRGPGLPRPRRRPGQARRPPDRARRDRQRAARAAGGARRGRRGPAHGGGQHAAGRLRRRRGPASTPSGRSHELRETMPAALVPRLADVDDAADPDLGQDRPRRAALAAARRPAPPTSTRPSLDGTAAWVAGLWLDVLGAEVRSGDDDFFDLGGGSLTAAQLVSPAADALPRGHGRPTSTSTRRWARLAAALDAMAAPAARSPAARVRPIPRQDPGRPGASSRSRCGPLPACAG